MPARCTSRRWPYGPRAGDKITIAETQLGLADLSLEEGHPPAEQEATIRQALEVFQTQKVRDDETLAWCVLARALLAEGKAAAAKEAMQHARALAAKSQNPNIRWPTAITAARIEIAEKDFAHSAAADAARKELATIITKSRELGYMGIELDARLALAEIEMKSGQTTAGRAHLAATRGGCQGQRLQPNRPQSCHRSRLSFPLKQKNGDVPAIFVSR